MVWEMKIETFEDMKKKKKTVFPIPTMGFPADQTELLFPVIPKKRRSSFDETFIENKKKKTEPPIMSDFEAATILLQLAYSNVKNPFGDSEKKDSKAKPLPEKIKKKRNNNQKKTTKKKKTTTKKKKKQEDVYTPDLPLVMRDRIIEMGGHQIQLLIQKKLEVTDVDTNQGRLNLSSTKLKTDNFLTEEEDAFLDELDEKNNRNKISVTIMDPFLREKTISLKKWWIGSRPSYCLSTKWNDLASDNLLENGDIIQVWCFRIERDDASTGICESKLYLAMVKLDVNVNPLN